MEARIILPPIQALDTAAAHLISQAAGDTSAERALNKALWNLQSGTEIRATSGGFLLASGSRAGVVHRLSTMLGCSCEAARASRVCWHASALAIIIEAQRYTMPALISMPEGDTLDTEGMRAQRPMGERLAAARLATDRLNELFA